MDARVQLAELIVTSVLAAAGLWLANDLRRQQRLKIAEQRIEAYRDLWALMKDARASRGDGTDPHGDGALARGEALKIFDAMTDWYYDEGRGLFLTERTKEMYLEAKERLGLYARGQGETATAGIRRIRELSLLRTQMKSDVGIYGAFYYHELKPADREFLQARKIDPDRWQTELEPLGSRVRRRLGR
jgi:hypothetical protein